MTKIQTLKIPIPDGQWKLLNHRGYYHARTRLRNRVARLASKRLQPITTSVQVAVQAVIRDGMLCDVDAIAPMVKPILDGFVDAGIIPDDNGSNIEFLSYVKPVKDITLDTKRCLVVALKYNGKENHERS